MTAARISVDQDAVRSRCSGVAQQLRGDERAAGQFTGAAAGAIAVTDGRAPSDAERYARAVSQAVTASTRVADDLQKFVVNATGQIVLVDASTVIPAPAPLPPPLPADGPQ